MSDFFTRLTQRTLGRAAVARPDIAPAVTTQTRGEGPEVEVPPLEPAQLARTAGRQPSERPATIPLASEGSAMAQTVAFTRVPLARPATERPIVDMGERATNELASATALRSTSSRPRSAGDATVAARSASTDIDSGSQRGSATGPVRGASNEGPRPAVRDAGSNAARGWQERDPVPPVRLPAISVSIGRIEVRAAASSGQRETARAVQARPRQLRSLESYLRERNRTTP